MDCMLNLRPANIPNKLYVLRVGCDVVGQLEIGINLYFYNITREQVCFENILKGNILFSTIFGFSLINFVILEFDCISSLTVL